MGINRCMNCGAEDFVPYEMHDEYTNPQLCYHVCPECGSEEIEDGNACTLCGRYAGDGSVCDDCADNLRDRFHELLICNFTPEEIRALNEIYDGKELA